MSYALVNATLFDGERFIQEHAVVVNGQQIEAIVPQNYLNAEVKQVKLDGLTLCPGFIDLQLNGCGGVMLNGDFTSANLAHMHQTNLASGTTSYLPTLVTTSDEEMERAISVTRDYQALGHSHTLGLHLEGPYLSVAKKGIHAEHYIRQLSQQRIDLLCQSSDVITKITLAPENVSQRHIQQLSEAGIIVSIGHTNASYSQCSPAFEAGASFATHLFNAMSPMTGREPGAVGAVFDHGIYAGIIVDGHHVDYANVRLAQRLLGERLCLVSDATAAAGADIQDFDFVGRKITVRDGICVGDDGTLGGSALTMIEAVANSVQQAKLPLDEVLKMASRYPATAIGQEHRLGLIRQGYQANLCAFDQDFQVKMSISDGQANYF